MDTEIDENNAKDLIFALQNNTVRTFFFLSALFVFLSSMQPLINLSLNRITFKDNAATTFYEVFGKISVSIILFLLRRFLSSLSDVELNDT